MPSSIVDPYLKIQAALAADSVDEVRANAGDHGDAATPAGRRPAFKIGDGGCAADVGDRAGRCARQKFGTLSDADHRPTWTACT